MLQNQSKIDGHNLRYNQRLESFSMKLWEFSDMPFKDLNGLRRRNTIFAGTGEIRAFDEPAIEEQLKSSIDNHARIHATMDSADDNFLSYKSGVYKCKSPELKLQLKVLIIGYGTENNIDYWLCKNELGTSFGESGTFKITRRNSPCLIKPIQM